MTSTTQSGGADALSTGGNSRSSGQEQSVSLTDAYYASAGLSLAKTMGMATLLSQTEFDGKIAKIQSIVGASTASQRTALELALVYYFSAHGTSPQTPWSTYDKPFVFEGRTFPPYTIVSVVGEGRLKQFMGRFSKHVPKLFANSAEFRAAMSERAGRAGLDPDEGLLAVDFYGKDGSLDSASVGRKSDARGRALKYRSGNVTGVMTQTRQNAVEERNNSLPVVPMGLKTSFNRQA